LPPEVLSLIADRVSSNIRELEGSLNRILTHCKVYNIPITKDVVANILTAYSGGDEKRAAKKANPDDILKAVCQHYQIEPEQIKGTSRKRDYVVPRQIAMYLMRELSRQSLNQIGAIFGGKDHTTVLHSCQKVESARTDDSQLKRDLATIEQSL